MIRGKSLAKIQPREMRCHQNRSSLFHSIAVIITLFYNRSQKKNGLACNQISSGFDSFEVCVSGDPNVNTHIARNKYIGRSSGCFVWKSCLVTHTRTIIFLPFAIQNRPKQKLILAYNKQQNSLEVFTIIKKSLLLKFALSI